MDGTTACEWCRATIRWVASPAGPVPLDLGRDPAGSLMAVKIDRSTWGVRALRDGEQAPEGRPRYVPHWCSCPHPHRWRAQALKLAPETWCERPGALGGARGTPWGPCTRCGATTRRYGEHGNPLCPECWAALGTPLPPEIASLRTPPPPTESERS